MRMKRAVLTSLGLAALVASAHVPALAQSPELDEILKRKPALRTFTP